MQLPKIHKEAQLALLNEEYDKAYQAFKQAWDVGDRSQGDNVIRCLLVSCQTPDYAKAKAIYRRMSVPEKRRSIVWFYMYYRDRLGQSKAKKLLPLAYQLGAEFVNAVYAHHYYPSNPRLSLKFYRRNYISAKFGLNHPWEIKLLVILTCMTPYKWVIDKAWSQFVDYRENTERAERKKWFLLSSLKGVMDDIKSFFNRKK